MAFCCQGKEIVFSSQDWISRKKILLRERLRMPLWRIDNSWINRARSARTSPNIIQVNKVRRERDVHKFINSCFSPVRLPFLWLFFLSFTEILSAGLGNPVLSAISVDSLPRQLIMSWTSLPYLFSFIYLRALKERSGKLSNWQHLRKRINKRRVQGAKKSKSYQ